MFFQNKQNNTLFLYIYLIISFLFCNTVAAKEISRKEYIKTYQHIAIRQMNQYGIPASIILAQACLESGNGNSRLAVQANNHFGIKCHNWTGKKIYHDDDQKGECFRKYTNAEDSFKDHSEFLSNGKRYQSLFDLKKTDYKSWAHGLKAAGYATNPKYAQMLIDIIEDNQLYQYDDLKSSMSEYKNLQQEYNITNKENRKAQREARKQARKEARKKKKEGGALLIGGIAAGGSAAGTTTNVAAAKNSKSLSESNLYKFSLDRQLYTNNGVAYVVATGEESYAMLAKEYNLFKREILKFNDLTTDAPIAAGTIVYIQKKKNKGEKAAYVVQEGDTMHSISQSLGIRLLKLYQLNKMKYGTEAEVGKILNLQ